MSSLPQKKAWSLHDYSLAHEARVTYLNDIGGKALIISCSFVLLSHFLVLATLSAVCFTGTYEKNLLGGLCLIFTPLAEFSIIYSVAMRAYTHNLTSPFR